MKPKFTAKEFIEMARRHKHTWFHAMDHDDPWRIAALGPCDCVECQAKQADEIKEDPEK